MWKVVNNMHAINLCQAVQFDKTKAGAELACCRSLCVCSRHTQCSVNFKQQWIREGSCTCPFVLFSAGWEVEQGVWGESLCSAQISVEYSGKFQSINHMASDNNRLLYSAFYFELQSARINEKQDELKTSVAGPCCLCFLYTQGVHLHMHTVAFHSNRLSKNVNI